MNTPTISALLTFPDQLQSLYEAFPRESKHWAPPSWEGIPSEALTAIEQVCHVLDIEVEGYQVRIRRTLEEENPALPSLDTDAMAQDRCYYMKDATSILQGFRSARSHTIHLLRSLAPEQLNRPARFEGYGQVTLRGLVHFLCSHDQQHLSGLQWLLGKLSSSTTSNAA
jgi:DinB superfamily